MMGKNWLVKLSELFQGVLGDPKKDPWNGCNRSHHVFGFRRELNNIAGLLSYREGRRAVFVQFNRNKQCAELLTEKSGVIARVNVFLGKKNASRYLIIVDSDLSENSTALFRALSALDAEVEFRIMSNE